MADLQPIRRVVARTRRRLRLQAALEGATTAGILAVAAALVALWFWRMELVSSAQAVGIVAGAVGLIVVGALVLALRRHPENAVATRLDRASGLADRLGTALDFERRVATEPHPDIQALMRAAIDDALRHVPRANVRVAAPFRTPRDLRALSAFVVVGAAIAGLAFHPTPPPLPLALRGATPGTAPATPTPEPETLDADDVDYQKQFVEEMKEIAASTQDENLKQLTDELQKLLDQAARGEISKQALLEQMDALERKYSQGGSDNLDKLLGGLKDLGQDLKKNKVTQRLGEALEKGDMDAAQKELERLADQIDKGEMKPEEQKQLAEALEKAADKAEQKDKKEAEKEQKVADKKVKDKQEEIRRLEKKVAQNQNDEESKRTLEREKRELERLEREQKQEGEQPKRELQRLSRNLKNSAENMKEKNKYNSSKQLKNTGEDLKRVSQKMKNQQNQKRVQSQMRDLKDAISRAKPRKGNGKKSAGEAMREQRIQEWERRAGGLRGNPGAWRQTGEGQGQNGQNGQNGNGQNGQQTGERWGTEHDPNLTDDPTRMANPKFADDQLKGREGQGASRRETILTSAQKGFAQTSYRKVYTDYKKVVEEVINAEKVPQGYKYYVKRYFQRIKPHSMDE